MEQEIITYIVIALAVMEVRKMTEGILKKTKRGHTCASKIKRRGAAGEIDCSDCTSKCALFKECGENRI